MHLLRATRFALQRQLLLRCPLSTVVLPSADEASIRVLRGGEAGVRRRRNFSTTSEESSSSSSSTSSSNRPSEEVERNLEQYTSYVLRSQMVPLGTMNADQWEEVLSAMEYWMTRMTHTDGFAIDTAERLFQRLSYEHMAAGSSRRSMRDDARGATLDELRRSILQAWLTLQLDHPGSMLGLQRSERAFTTVLDSSTSSLSSETFPIHELLLFLDGCLQNQTSLGIQRAAEILLTCTDSSHFQYLQNHTNDVGPYFSQILVQQLLMAQQTEPSESSLNSSIVSQLLDRMDTLRREPFWAELQLSTEAQRALDAASQLQMEEDCATIAPSMPEATTSSTTSSTTASSTTAAKEKTTTNLSSFEAEAMQKKMIGMLRDAGTDNQEAITKALRRNQALREPSDELQVSLVDYYLRMGDAENASLWVSRLPMARILPAGQSPTLLDRLLDVWSQQSHPRAPWRAEEFFRQLLESIQAQDESLLTVSTMNRFLQIWSSSSDPAASRKVREWFSRMTESSMNLKPDGTSLRLVLKAMDGNVGAAESLFSSLADEWDQMKRSEKTETAKALMEAAKSSDSLPPSTIDLLSLFQEDNLDIWPEHYKKALEKVVSGTNPVDVIDTVERIKQRGRPTDQLLPVYQVAIKCLIQHNRDYLPMIESLWKEAFAGLADDQVNVTGKDFGEFVGGVINMYVHRKYFGMAEKFLLAAEEIVATTKKEETAEYPIPLDAYRRLIVRKWYRPEAAPKIIETFERLQKLAQNGHDDLKPDKEIYTGFMAAKAISAPTEAADLEAILKDMIESYFETKDEKFKPDTQVFNIILLTYIGEDKSKSERSIQLWKRMVGLNIPPDTKTISLIIAHVTQDESHKNMYSTISELYKKIEEHQLTPDSRTLHSVMTVCSQAEPNQQNDALQICLKAFGEIRRRDDTTLFTYATLTRCFRRLLRRGPVADKVAASTLQLCYEDGLLGPKVKEAYKSIITNVVWKRLYKDRLANGEVEPAEWSRHLLN